MRILLLLAALLLACAPETETSEDVDTSSPDFQCFLDFPCFAFVGGSGETCSSDHRSIRSLYTYTEPDCSGGQCQVRSETTCEGEMRCATTTEGPLCLAPDARCGGPDALTCGEGEVCVLGTQYTDHGMTSIEACDAYEAQSYGRCEADLADCTTEIDPVCGCDGVTYDNGCLLRKAGVPIRSEGACEG